VSGRRFTKLDGAGNDFVLLEVDAREADALLGGGELAAICDRRRGVGADGVLLTTPVDRRTLKLRYANADGREAALCGNGVRCAARYAVDHGLTGPDLVIDTPTGRLRARVTAESVSAEMPPPREPARSLVFDDVEPGLRADLLTVGVPHLLLLVPRIDAAPVLSLGPRLRSHAALGSAGANVNFVETRGVDRLALRTFERGVESETLACGTGAVAAAWWSVRGAARFRVRVETRGGDELEVLADDGGLWLSGPTREVFRGELTVDPRAGGR
jgi:diaminopimelate epimerase